MDFLRFVPDFHNKVFVHRNVHKHIRGFAKTIHIDSFFKNGKIINIYQDEISLAFC